MSKHEEGEQQQVREIRFEANPTQYAFIVSQADADLFACRMGEGKSTALVWACYYHTRENPGARWAMIRDTWENLRDTTMKSFFEWFPIGVMGRYKAADKTFTWEAEGMRGEVMFLGMDDPKDAAKLQSRELAGFGMDEPAPAAESGGISEFIFDTAMTRLRQKGMKWYAAKLAENNPDEGHWTYRRFVDPGSKTFSFFQTQKAENAKNLPKGYYEKVASALSHRPDLVRRFVQGHFGFQQIGSPVTPQWSDEIHLAEHLEPVAGVELKLLWDFGLNPTCNITQVTPLGNWLVLESHVGDSIGLYEMISHVIRPRLTDRFKGFEWMHIGDPAGAYREQSSSEQSAVKVLKAELGGRWKPGPVRIEERIDPLQWVLAQTKGGAGLVRVDKHLARPVWHALRGGWHRNVGRSGVTAEMPLKNMHSHPGDAMGYGAAVLFPQGRLQKRKSLLAATRSPRYFGGRGLGFERPGAKVPSDPIPETPAGGSNPFS